MIESNGAPLHPLDRWIVGLGGVFGVCIGAVIFASTWLMLLGIVAFLVGFACFVRTRRQYRQKIGGGKP